MYERVSLEELDELAAAYRNTAEETRDLKEHYLACKGDMGKIMDHMMFSTAEDEPRFRETLQQLIGSGELKSLRAFSAEPESKKRARERTAAKEAKEAEAAAKELGFKRCGGGNDLDSLRSAIALRDATRKNQFGSMIDSLEERFSKKFDKRKTSKKGYSGGSTLHEDPLDDEAFAATQARMLGKGKSKR